MMAAKMANPTTTDATTMPAIAPEDRPHEFSVDTTTVNAVDPYCKFGGLEYARHELFVVLVKLEYVPETLP